MLRFGYKTPLSPIGDWLLKILKILVLSKRKLVIRYVGVQVQTPSSCRPCPFCTYCHKVKHKRFSLLVGVSLVNTDAIRPMKNEKKFMQMAVRIIKAVFSFMNEQGRCFHPKSLLSRAKSHSLAALVVHLDDALLIAVPVVGNDATVNVSLPEEVWLLVLGLCALHDNTVV